MAQHTTSASPLQKALLLVTSVIGISIASHGAEFRQGDKVTVTGDFTDNLFAAGAQLDGTFDSSDDVYLAGNQVTYQGRTTESLYLAAFDLAVSRGAARNAVLAGANIRIDQAQFRELILFGGNVVLNATEIADDLVLSGGNLQIGEQTSVRDSVTVAGGEIVFRGKAGGDARFVGAKIILSGTFAGDVDVAAEELEIRSGTVIKGNLTHQTADFEISPEARVEGETRAIAISRRERHGPGALGYVWGVLSVIGLLLVPAVFALCAPRLMERGDQIFRKDFWESLGKGTAGAILIPFTMVLLVAIGLGATLALAAIPFLIALWILAITLGAYVVGAFLARKLKLGALTLQGGRSHRAAAFLQALLGTVVLLVISWIPFLGAIFAVILGLACFGALLVRAQEGAVAQETP